MSIKIMFLRFSFKLFFFFIFILSIIFVSGQSFSKELAKYKDWKVFAEGEGKNLACLAISKPLKSQGDYKKRGDIFATVTHFPGQDRWNEFSVVAGYNYKADSNPSATIGDVKYKLFTSGSRAWSFSPSDDEKIIRSLKSSMKMNIMGTSSRGTITTDTYSLMGFSKAYQKINEVCKKK